DVAEQAALRAREQKAAEIRRQAAEEADTSRGNLEKQRQELEVQASSVVEPDDAEPEPIVSQAATGSLKVVVERLQAQLARELQAKEFLDVEAEEVQLTLEDVRESALLVASNDTWTEEVQVEWHKEALWAYYKNHRAEVLRLRHKVAALERAQQQAQQVKNISSEDVSALKRQVEQLAQQNEVLNTTLSTKKKYLEEQRFLQQTGREMLETQDDLETCLSEELEVLKAREQQLEQVALALCQKRQSLQRQREERRSEVARLEIRLHSLRSCGAATTAAAADLADIEAETLEASVDCREAVAEAEAWMSCLPSQVLDDAELGSSFESLCALFRCFHKARILAQSIQDHFVATAALAVLQDVGTMRWLCSVMQAAAMLATAVLGVLGCLSAESPDRYRGLVRLPAVASCGHGEAALDALLRALLDLVRGKATREREGLLAALRAHGAQLLSLQKAMFKDQHFASWQRCCCALEALRGSCAGALYASSNAGGTRRKRWQDLYEEANRFIARLVACEDFGSRPLFGIGPSEQEVQKSDSEDASEEEEEEGEEPHEKEAPKQQLTQLHVDAVVRQAQSLDLAAHQGKEDALDKTLSLAEKELGTLVALFEATQKTAPAAPWEKVRQSKRSSLEVAEQAAQPAFEQANKGLQKVELSMTTAQERLDRAKQEMNQVEQQFGVARIESERASASWQRRPRCCATRSPSVRGARQVSSRTPSTQWPWRGSSAPPPPRPPRRAWRCRLRRMPPRRGRRGCRCAWTSTSCSFCTPRCCGERQKK
ncbi:unnamed protein product, partial [Effrenium voratum]